MTTYTQRADNFIASLGFPDAARVGGSVRDGLLGRRAKDADYVVRGVDRQTLKNRVRKTGTDVVDLKLRDGQKVGVIAYPKGLGKIEIALPRTERKIESAAVGNTRHAFEMIVDPSVTYAEDAVRRDLTINAIYRVVGSGEIIDPLDGQIDLEHMLLRTTHESSFRDDPLRILRTARFLATLPDGFEVSPSTYVEMQVHADAVTGLTGKGVSGTAQDELFKLLMGRNVADALRLLRGTGVLAVFLPELAPMLGHDAQNDHHEYTTDEHTFEALEVAARMDAPLRVRLALLFHDSGKPEVEWIGKDGMKHYFESKDVPGSEDHAVAGARRFRKAANRLNIPNDLKRDSARLIEKHMVPLSMRVKSTKIRKWRTELGDRLLADLFKHRLADVIAKGGTLDYDAMRAIARMEGIRDEAEHAGIPASVKDMKDAGLVSGHDLIEMGIEGGKIGKVLDAVLHEVVSQPDKATREWVLSRAEALAKK